MKRSGLFSLVGFILLMFWYGPEPSNPHLLKAASVHVITRSCLGSGTVVKTIEGKDFHLSYILSAAHLTGANIGDFVIVDFHYLNGTKLNKQYIGRMVWKDYNYQGLDYSIIEILTYEKPTAIPLAKKSYLTIGDSLTSIGFDGKATTPQVNDLRFFKERDNHDDLLTCFNTPRPGRSGGGLFRNNKLVGVCWGYLVKTNHGLFTTLEALRKSINNSPYYFLIESDE